MLYCSTVCALSSMKKSHILNCVPLFSIRSVRDSWSLDLLSHQTACKVTLSQFALRLHSSLN